MELEFYHRQRGQGFNQIKFQYSTFDQLNRKQIRRLKLIHRKIFNEQWKLYVLSQKDVIFTAIDIKSDNELAMGIIKEFSPERHFSNEFHGSNIPYLIDFGVLPKHQKKGIGGEFLKYIIKYVENTNVGITMNSMINLDIYLGFDIESSIRNEQNNFLIKFYKKYGFIVCGYYSTPLSKNPKEYICLTYNMFS
jgi:GNAT superfamily N-acetyltransferase